MKTAGSFVLTFLVAGLLARPVSAQTTEYWDPGLSATGQTDGTGTWNTGNVNWYNPSSGSNPVTWDNSSTDTAIFGQTSSAGSGNIVITGTVNVGTIDMATGNGGGYSFNSGGGTVVGNSGVLTIENGSTTQSSAGYFFNGITFNASTINFTSANGLGVKIINSTINGNQAVTFNLGTGSDTGVLIAGGGGFNIAKITANVANGWTYSMFEGSDLASAKITGFGNTKEPGGLDFYEGALSINSSTAATTPTTTIPTITLNGDALISNGSSANGAGSSILGNGQTTGTNGGTTITGTGNLYLSGGQFRQYASGAQSKTTVQSLIMKTVGDNYTGATIISENTMHEGSSEEGAGLGYQTVALGVNNALANTELVLGVKSGTAPITGATVPTYTSNGVFDLAGFNQTVTGIATGAGTTASGNYIGNNSGSGNSVLSIDGTSATGEFGGTIVDNLGTTGGTTEIDVIGGGTLSLNGNLNTYSGGTKVNGSGTVGGIGTLYADSTSASSTGSGSVTVTGTSSSSYGVLGGGVNNLIGNLASSVAKDKVFASNNEVVTGTVSVSSFGHIAPGDTVGTPTTIEVGALSLGSGANADFDITSTANDYILDDGSLTLTSGIVFNLNFVGVSNEAGIYDVIGYKGSQTGFSASDFTVMGLGSGYSATVLNDTTDADGLPVIQIQVTASSTPEPSTWAMLLLGVGALVWIGRVRASARA